VKTPTPLVDFLRVLRLGRTPYLLCRSVRILPRVFRSERPVLYQWVVGLN
jgi:hypothetical protein